MGALYRDQYQSSHSGHQSGGASRHSRGTADPRGGSSGSTGGIGGGKCVPVRFKNGRRHADGGASGVRPGLQAPERACMAGWCVCSGPAVGDPRVPSRFCAVPSLARRGLA